MAMTKASKIWMNGKWVAWDDARIHILSHVVHYASSVFEGIRCYDSRRGPAIFRLDRHLRRFMLSAKIYRMELPFTREQIEKACIEVVALNDLKECYIRPLIYRGYENLGVNPFGNPIDVAVAAFPWGKYLGEDALSKGVAAKVSTWQRMAPNTMPAMAKASSNYMNSQLMKMEALVDGYSEAIALDVSGFVSEGSGQNLLPSSTARSSRRRSRAASSRASRASPSSRWRASWATRCGRRSCPASSSTPPRSCSTAAPRSRSRPSPRSTASPWATARAAP